MRIEELKKREGEITILDLVNGAQITTEVQKVSDDGYVTIGKVLLFQVSVEPSNPAVPPHPQTNPLEHRVRNGSYGYPLFEVNPGTEIDAAHIVMVHVPHGDMIKVYTQVTTGIELADAGALSALNAANTPRR